MFQLFSTGWQSVSPFSSSSSQATQSFLLFDFAFSYNTDSSHTRYPIYQDLASASASFILPPGQLSLMVTAYDTRAPNSVTTLTQTATVSLPQSLTFASLNAMLPQLVMDASNQGDQATAMYNSYCVAEVMSQLPGASTSSCRLSNLAV